jgi:hypothetical protein
MFFLNYIVDTHNTHVHSPLWIHVHKTYPYEHIRRIESADLSIYEVTIGASLSTGMLPTTISIAPLNPKINLGKYEHSCQVEDLKPDGQIPPQGAQPTELWSVHNTLIYVDGWWLI